MRATPFMPLRGGVAALLVVTALTPGSSFADIYHLDTGGSISGQLIDVDGDFFHIRTLVGEVRVPIASVTEVEQAETPFDEYDQRRAAAADTAEAQTALAKWCAEREMSSERRKHLERALAHDPDYAPARRALGYVRVGDLWVEARTVVGHTPRREAPAADEAERLAQAVQIQWTRHIRAVQRSCLESDSSERVAEGRKRILEIDDPLAILPLVRVLSAGPAAERRLLVEALAGYALDEATMNLAVIGLIDPDDDVRQLAVSELIRRKDPRVLREYRRALHTASDIVVMHAAEALGRMKDAVAVPDLIELLTARRRRPVIVKMNDYFALWPYAFSGARQSIRLGGLSYGSDIYPTLGYYYLADEVINDWQYRTVTVFRTEVLEALRDITGVDFGFEREQWRRWYREQQPPPASAPATEPS